MKMARANFGSMSVEALIKLRDEVGQVLNQRTALLRSQLSKLGGEIGGPGRGTPMKGRKVAIKYRDKAGNTWAGRGAHPVWLREKLEDFAVQKNSACSQSFPEENKEAPT
jgi:DNA-binding protein H-NS